MLVALLMLYMYGDLRSLTPAQLAEAHVSTAVVGQPRAGTYLQHLGSGEDRPTCRVAVQPDVVGPFGAWWAFLLLLIGFLVKVPSVPIHTWLPDAHVEAPTPISMILAGVLLKMGGYGIIRICYPICPEAGYDLAWLVVGLGVVSMVYGAFAAMAQKDFKRLVAYSSVSHMGYVVLGIGVWSAWPRPPTTATTGRWV